MIRYGGHAAPYVQEKAEVPQTEFRGRLTRKTYQSLEEMRHYENREAMRLNVPTEEEAAFENLPAEKIRELFNKAAEEETQRQAKLRTNEDIQTWLDLHPEYDDAIGCANGELIKHYWHSRGVQYPNLYQLEEAYESLKATGLLRLKPDVLRSQQTEEHQRRAKEIAAKGGVFATKSADELASECADMSLEDIRRQATLAGF